MSFANPTQLRIGMTGNLSGKSYRVAGRVVLGMDDGGETYYWNEFNLLADDGDSATLVYEVTERGGEWKLFTLFEPEYPMTAADAATKRVGDPLNLDGMDVRVTLVDESRVYHIEGAAPEGVEIGDVAQYFNAEAQNTMQVVSWTGDEVEYYRGANLPGSVVPSAFGIRAPMTASLLPSPQDGSSSSGSVLKIVLLFFIGVVFFAGRSSCEPFRHRPALVKVSAPAAPLTLGSTARLDGKHYRIVGHAVVDIAQVGSLYSRHEYRVLDDDGAGALLIYGLKPKAEDYAIFTPFQPSDPMTPTQAAALRAGDRVSFEGYVATVSELFQSTVRQYELESSQSPDVKNGDVLYDFSGSSGETLLLARWNSGGIVFYKGKALPAKEVAAAFLKIKN